MFDLMPIKRHSTVPNVFSQMNEMVNKMWFDFPFHNLQEDMDISWSPHLDVSETDNSLEIVVDLPGMKKKDISVSVEDNLLTIKGEKKKVKERKDKQYHTIERSSGSFYRAVRLPMEVESDKIEANFKDGVLSLCLPKSKNSKQKVAQIEIK